MYDAEVQRSKFTAINRFFHVTLQKTLSDIYLIINWVTILLSESDPEVLQPNNTIDIHSKYIQVSDRSSLLSLRCLGTLELFLVHALHRFTGYIPDIRIDSIFLQCYQGRDLT